ncbi:hypothetical protein FRACYDRAFT_241410 [Fragilariopsis cylindrus CCMP1102]|uniref:Uncharacterized protein n=1 Tax=Fragilariopsis cylindrus CCMP1102 TaxID=635003 RepID=A0A1E7FAI3_9STRA|nr:hypothetical protein FRACYDRAFT_241410 [Fragilariopsis cylindrus CCMP1102]|eukprot:OEU14853.1 hypothetical protein FRACYDRAFT_241410 [Fragilariopsis cylindrus CCMP1102]
MASLLIIGTAAVSVAGTGMKTAASEGYKKKVQAMKAEGNFEYIALGEISYHYTRPLRDMLHGSSRNIKDPVYSSIAQVKQSIEGNGENRILAVVRQQKKNGSEEVNFILLKSPNIINKRFDEKDPLNSCSIDPNLKTNQGGIVESRNLKVVRKNPNTFQIEDINYRTIQTHKKILEIVVKNTKGTSPKGDAKLSGTTLCELLNHMAKEGRVPKDFPSILPRDSIRKDENENENKTSSSSLASSSSIMSPVDEIVLENHSTTRIDDDNVITENNDNEDVDNAPATTNVDSYISSFTEVATSQDETTIIETATATATATVLSEHDDDEVIPVAMATPVE